MRFIYTQGTQGYDITASVDEDWRGDIETRRAMTGFIIAINATPIYWRSNGQAVIAISPGEAEYVAMSSCTKRNHVDQATILEDDLLLFLEIHYRNYPSNPDLQI